jgi:hypothetical protein
MVDSASGPRVSPASSKWVQDLPLREALSSGKADAWDELNHLDETYLEFSMASDIPRGLMLFAGLVPLGFGFVVLPDSISDVGKGQMDFLLGAVFLATFGLLALSVFALRFDLRLPKDRPIRFNRRQRKVYANYYIWNHNPFGRWGGGVKVFDWNNLQAEITRQVGASGEVITQRYSLELVLCKPGTFEEVDRFRLQHGAQTTVQYEEQWELLRHYMNKGLEGLPPQDLRNRNPGFIDCLLFAMPWFAPTEEGRRARSRMKGFLGTLMMAAMSLLAPMWLLFGLGNFVVMKLAPEASWPPGIDEESRR